MANIPGTLTNSIFTGMGPGRLEPQKQLPVLAKFKSRLELHHKPHFHKSELKKPAYSPRTPIEFQGNLRTATGPAPLLGSGTFPLWTC